MRPVLPVLVLLAACQPDGGLTKFNPAPEASILAPGDGDTVVEGSALALRGSVTDANHAPSELLARWFLDGVEACAEAAPASSGETACEVTVPSADTVVRLEVRDPEGSTGSAEIALVVVQDAAPQVAITAPATDARLYSDRLVRLAGTATDAEDAPADLALRWVSSRDGELSVSNAVSADGAVEAFATLYRLPALPDGDEAQLEAIGRRRGFLGKGGVVQVDRAAERVLLDLREGALGRLTLERP